MKVAFLVALGLFVVVSADAGPCDLSCSLVPGMIIMSPDGALSYTLTISCCNTGPVQGALVEIEFAPEAVDLVAWSSEETPPLFTGFTDVDGIATFHIAGSGCIDFARYQPSTFIAQVRVNAIVMAEPGVTSPDVVNSLGKLPTQLGGNICENGITSAGLADAVFHTNPIKLGRVEPCSKFSGFPEDPVGLEDAVIITPYIKLGIWTTCTSSP